VDFLALEDGSDRLSRNVGNYHYTLRNDPEERRISSAFAAEAWNHAMHQVLIGHQHGRTNQPIKAQWLLYVPPDLTLQKFYSLPLKCISATFTDL